MIADAADDADDYLRMLRQVCFDNLSRLPEDLATAEYRLVTGGGFGGRQLYSNYDEAIFNATRPLVFKAIPDLGTARPDFLDRALIVEFLALPPELRRDEARYWSEFSVRQARILGALLDAAVAGMRNLPRVRLERPPRLADFALWVSACEEALGMKQGETVAACWANSAEARDLTLEASPLYAPLVELAREGFTGTVAELRARLDSMVSELNAVAHNLFLRRLAAAAVIVSGMRVLINYRNT